MIQNWFRPRMASAYLPMVLGLAIAAYGQERFGEVTGTVKDPSGAAVPGASVQFTELKTNRVLNFTSTGDGTYLAPSLEPGRYKLRVESKGFSIAEIPDVVVLVGKSVRLDVTLQVGQTTETVQVTDAAPLIDFSSTKVATNVTVEEFDRLPKGRSFQTVAIQATGVNTGDIEGGIQINGASGAENQFNIDGVSVTSSINGKQRQNALYETLAEVQVKTGGLDAEYGGAMGGVVSAITKSGGNEFHGDLHYYLSGNPISVGPVKRLVMNPSTEKEGAYFQDTKFKDTNNEIGGSLGGPFIKNKLYFYTMFSPRYRRQNQDYVLTDGRETLQRDQDYHAWWSKLTWDVRNNVRANFTYLWSPTRSNGSLPAYDGFCPNCRASTVAAVQPNKQIGFSQPQTNYTGQIDWTATPTTLFTFRGGRFWDNFKTLGIPQISAVEYGSSATALPFDIPAALRQPSGYSNTPRQPNTAFDIATRTYFQVDGSKVARLGGQHNFKAGWGVTKNVNKVDNFYPGNGYVRIFWNGAFTPSATSGLTGPQRGTYGYYEVNQIGTAGSTGGTMHNIYFQDTWRIKDRLTLSLGVRMENESVPSFARAVQDPAFSFGFGDKVAPRIGVSYDMFGDGRIKLYGSYDRTYDWVKYELSRGTFGGDYWRIYYRSLDSLDNIFGLAQSLNGRNIWNTTAGSFRNRRVPGFDLVAPGIKPMSTDKYTGGAEISLGPAMVLRVGYVHNQLIRTIEDLGALDANGDEVYLYGNPGEGVAKIQPTSGATKPFPMPKPVRKYDAVEFQLTKRFSRGYFYNASYVISRLYGNYAGIANSDEVSLPSTNRSSATAQQLGGSIARQGGNANRSWDLDEILFDSKGNVDIRGRLATDRPHVFKFFGGKDITSKLGVTNASIGFYAGSGTPVTTQVYTTNQIPIFVNGRGDMGRTPFLTQFDLNLYHDFKLAERKTLRFEMNMLNLFNQQTARGIFNSVNRGARQAEGGSAINLANVDLFKGFDYNALIAATPDARGTRGALDPLFGKQDLFNTGFQGRFGIKFIF